MKTEDPTFVSERSWQHCRTLNESECDSTEILYRNLVKGLAIFESACTVVAMLLYLAFIGHFLFVVKLKSAHSMIQFQICLSVLLCHLATGLGSLMAPCHSWSITDETVFVNVCTAVSAVQLFSCVATFNWKVLENLYIQYLVSKEFRKCYVKEWLLAFKDKSCRNHHPNPCRLHQAIEEAPPGPRAVRPPPDPSAHQHPPHAHFSGKGQVDHQKRAAPFGRPKKVRRTFSRDLSHMELSQKDQQQRKTFSSKNRKDFHEKLVKELERYSRDQYWSGRGDWYPAAVVPEVLDAPVAGHGHGHHLPGQVQAPTSMTTPWASSTMSESLTALNCPTNKFTVEYFRWYVQKFPEELPPKWIWFVIGYLPPALMALVAVCTRPEVTHTYSDVLESQQAVVEDVLFWASIHGLDVYCSPGPQSRMMWFMVAQVPFLGLLALFLRIKSISLVKLTREMVHGVRLSNREMSTISQYVQYQNAREQRPTALIDPSVEKEHPIRAYLKSSSLLLQVMIIVWVLYSMHTIFVWGLAVPYGVMVTVQAIMFLTIYLLKGRSKDMSRMMAHWCCCPSFRTTKV